MCGQTPVAEIEIPLRVVGIRLEIDRPAAHKIGLDYGEFLVTDVTRQTFNRATVLTPVDTGNLRARNQMRVRRLTTRVVGEVFNNTKYAAAVHNGSGPYTIRAKKKKALRFVVDGQVVFAKSVRHPGTRGRPWIARAAQEVAVPQGFVWTPM